MLTNVPTTKPIFSVSLCCNVIYAKITSPFLSKESKHNFYDLPRERRSENEQTRRGREGERERERGGVDYETILRLVKLTLHE